MRHRRLVLSAGVAALAACAVLPTSVRAGLIAFDVAITKAHQGAFTVGQPGTFTITLKNVSANPNTTTSVDGFTVTDTLPSGLTFTSASATAFTCSTKGQTVTCTGAPNLTTGQSTTITLTVGVLASAIPQATNLVSFSDAFKADSNPANNSASDTVALNGATASPTPSPTTPRASSAPVAVPGTGAAGGAGPGAPLAIMLVAGGALALAGAAKARRGS